MTNLNQKLKIVLIQPFTLFSDMFDRKNVPILNLLEIATYARKITFKALKNVDIQVYNLSDENLIVKPKTINQYEQYRVSLEKWLDQFSHYDLLVFGLTAFTSNYYIACISLAKIIRSVFPKSYICVGGYHANFSQKEFEFPQKIYGKNIPAKLFDAIFLGEADKAFPEYIFSLYNNGSLISNTEESVKIINSDLINDLNLLPEVDYSLMQYPNIQNMVVSVAFSRGCPFNCNFCGDYRHILYETHKPLWRMITPERAIQLIKNLNQFFTKGFSLEMLDPIFCNTDWRLKFFEKLIEMDFDKLISPEVRVDGFNIDKEPLLLKKLQCELHFGVESASKDILTIMNKTKDPSSYLNKFTKIAEVLNENQIYGAYHFILGHPGETKDTLKEAELFLKNLLSNKDNVLLQFGKFQLTPGSQIYFNMKYYEDKFGTEFKYKKHWTIPGYYWETSTEINPSKDLSREQLILEAKEWLKELYAKTGLNLKQFHYNTVFYQKMKNNLINTTSFWKKGVIELYQNFPDPAEIENLTQTFWTKII